MNVAEWILVAILSLTLFVFLVIGIRLCIKLMEFLKKMSAIADEGQDIAKNVDGIVENVRGMTSIGGAVEMFVNKYITPYLKDNKTKHNNNNNKKES